MKKQMILIATVFAGTTLMAQKVKSSEVPEAIKSGFTKSFAVSEAEWDKEGANYEANFKKGGKEMSAVFDGTGSLLETETEITKKELPAAIQEAVKKDYAAFKIEEVAKIVAKGTTTYEVEVEKGEEAFDLIYDATGKLLKKERKERRRRG